MQRDGFSHGPRTAGDAMNALPSAGREVWYVSVTDFPRGLGSTTRARSMCQALAIAGYTTRLLIPYALGHGKNDEHEGSWQGVSFEYLNRSTTRPPTALRVALAKFRGNLTLFAGRYA